MSGFWAFFERHPVVFIVFGTLVAFTIGVGVIAYIFTGAL